MKSVRSSRCALSSNRHLSADQTWGGEKQREIPGGGAQVVVGGRTEKTNDVVKNFAQNLRRKYHNAALINYNIIVS